MSSGGYLHGGFRQKYNLTKVNGHPIDPGAKYFVLRYDAEGDPHARVALEAYASSVRSDNPQLSGDIFEELRQVLIQLKNKQRTGGEAE